MIAICAPVRLAGIKIPDPRGTSAEGIQLPIRRVHPRSRQLAVDGPGVSALGPSLKEKKNPACAMSAVLSSIRRKVMPQRPPKPDERDDADRDHKHCDLRTFATDFAFLSQPLPRVGACLHLVSLTLHPQ
jgi:hypothetical protein